MAHDKSQVTYVQKSPKSADKFLFMMIFFFIEMEQV